MEILFVDFELQLSGAGVADKALLMKKSNAF
jgi:hypothetical protein